MLATPLDLYSVRHLEGLLGHTSVELESLTRQAVRFYRPFPLKREPRPFSRTPASPKRRWIDNPIDPLKAIQSRTEERILKRVTLPDHLLGGVKGKSIRDNARRHLGARVVRGPSVQSVATVARRAAAAVFPDSSHSIT